MFKQRWWRICQTMRSAGSVHTKTKTNPIKYMLFNFIQHILVGMTAYNRVYIFFSFRITKLFLIHSIDQVKQWIKYGPSKKDMHKPLLIQRIDAKGELYIGMPYMNLRVKVKTTPSNKLLLHTHIYPHARTPMRIFVRRWSPCPRTNSFSIRPHTHATAHTCNMN